MGRGAGWGMCWGCLESETVPGRLTGREDAVITGSPDGWAAAALRMRVEESPGSTGIRCRLTAGGGDPRESATENKPPAYHPRGCRRQG